MKHKDSTANVGSKIGSKVLIGPTGSVYAGAGVMLGAILGSWTALVAATCPGVMEGGAILTAVGSAVRGGFNVQGAPLVVNGRAVVGQTAGTGNVRASIRYAMLKLEMKEAKLLTSFGPIFGLSGLYSVGMAALKLEAVRVIKAF